jgi:hypothetical protein
MLGISQVLERLLTSQDRFISNDLVTDMPVRLLNFGIHIPVHLTAVNIHVKARSHEPPLRELRPRLNPMIADTTKSSLSDKWTGLLRLQTSILREGRTHFPDAENSHALSLFRHSCSPFFAAPVKAPRGCGYGSWQDSTDIAAQKSKQYSLSFYRFMILQTNKILTIVYFSISCIVFWVISVER